MSQKTQLGSTDAILSENEGNQNYKANYEPAGFGYDTGSKNTVSTGNIKERNVYNPNAYTAGMNDIYKQQN
jgi:hypothetical protein